MKEGGFVCVLQVGRGWHCELVPMFDDRMGEEGGRGGEERRGEGRGYRSCGIKISAQQGERKMEGGLERGDEAKCEKNR